MADQKGSGDSWKRPLGEFITAFVLLTHAIVFFQLVICSKNMVVSFNIPTKNIGIYLGKLSGIRSLLMSVGGATEYGIYRSTSSVEDKNIRKYMSIFSLTCLTITRLIFLIFLYYPETASFRNYIVLIIGAFFVGSFQISAFSLASDFAALSWLSVYLSGILSFIIQVILDMCWSKRPSLTFKIQSWISLILSFISVGLWPYNLFFLTGTQTQSTTSGTTCSSTASASAAAAPAPQPPSAPMEYVMSLTSMSILKIMTCKLEEASEQLSSEAIMNVQMLIGRLHQIRDQSQITYDVLVAIDLVILSLKKCSCPSEKLCLLAELSLFLRMKVLINSPEQKQEQTTIQELSYLSGNLGVQNGKQCSSGESVVMAASRYIQTVKSVQSTAGNRQKRSLPEESKSRKRRQTSGGACAGTEQPQNTSNGGTSIYYSISPFLMFGAGSLVKDFLFPGVIPFGLLERDKCHLINLIVIIFLSVGPVVVFFINKYVDQFKSDHKWIHLFWSCMIPKMIIFFISLSAIHTKQSSTHQIRSSRWRVFLMAMILLTCYGFLETVNIVGVPNIAKGNPFRPDLIAINNICGKFVRYFVYKFSVGYNKTRISAGLVLPSFKPPEPIPNTFWFWCKGSFSNGWKDIKSDFKFNIKQYLTVTDPVLPKDVPILSSVYPDLLR